MWISKAKWQALESTNSKLNEEVKTLERLQHEKTIGLERMNARLQSDMDWFKLRLNQVERERGQLIQAAIGVKIAVPEFVPTYENPGAALHEMPDLSTVGFDAKDEGAPVMTGAEPGEGVDYSQLPGYGKR